MIFIIYRDPGRFGSPTILVVCATLCLFVGNIDRFDTIKANVSGFEAKTREAQAIVDQAKATVASLRELAVAVASFQVDMLAAAARFGGATTIARKDQQKALLLEHLQALGLTDEQLTAVENADRYWVTFDYALAILQPLNSPSDVVRREAYTKAFEAETALSPDECGKLLDQFHIDDERIRQLLLDYRYYYATGKQRRPEVWHHRD